MSCMTCSASTLGCSSASLGVSCRCAGDDEGDDVDAADELDARALSRYK